MAKQLKEKVESILDNYQRDKGMLVSITRIAGLAPETFGVCPDCRQ